MKGEIELVDLYKSYSDFTAVDGINLHIPGGQFFSLLGPSGCGKTTTLRMIAGFEQPTSGQVVLSGTDVAHTPPHKRNVNTVFQSYALFPHLTVEENVAFGLRFKDVAQKDTKGLVREALELVQMEEFAKRKPGQLSGGQQQRVALARALILHPDVLLLDEPLGALDAKLRKRLQIELKALQERVGITFVYVTHDQEEALTMSDRMAVMASGRIQQVGSPKQVYEEPETAYVADFLGASNLIDAHVLEGGKVRLGEFELNARGPHRATGPVKLLIRPERVKLQDAGSQDANCIPGILERRVYLGSASQIIVQLATGNTITAILGAADEGPEVDYDNKITVHFPPDSLKVLPVEEHEQVKSPEVAEPAEAAS
jgi:spermidine/putrescine transport system ATP-binding protein